MLTYGLIGFFASLVIVILLMPRYIKFLKMIRYNQVASEYSLAQYQEKAKTPTMGGTLFVIVPIVVTLLLFIKVLDTVSLLVILAFLAYGLIGFIDDYIIVIQQDNRGLSPKLKLIFQFTVAILFYLFYSQFVTTEVVIPFTDVHLELGAFYMFFAFIMFAGESNAVNLTDGMDGLAAGTSFLALIPFMLFAYQQSQFIIFTLIASVLGALLGYLKFNVYPAKIFMGDTGSLALGGLLAALAMVLKQELALLIIGGVFLWETLCVVIQIGSVKIRKKRVFKYTPIHYSFVISGMHETKVVRMFWMIGLICSIIGILIGVI